MDPHISALAFPVLTALVVVNGGDPPPPHMGDIYATLGASLATMVAFADAQHKRSPMWGVASKLVVTFFGGITLPGAVVHTGMASKLTFGLVQQDVAITWHVWAVLGFVFACLSFGLLKGAITLVEKYISEKINQ